MRATNRFSGWLWTRNRKPKTFLLLSHYFPGAQISYFFLRASRKWYTRVLSTITKFELIPIMRDFDAYSVQSIRQCIYQVEWGHNNTDKKTTKVICLAWKTSEDARAYRLVKVQLWKALIVQVEHTPTASRKPFTSLPPSNFPNETT